MAKKNRADTKTSISAKFFTNVVKFIKGNGLRDQLLDIADSFINLETDANVPNGYMAIDNNGRADYSFVKDVTPVGKYLRDDGTWGFIPASSSLNDGYIYIGNASNVATGVSPALNATGGSFALSNTGVFTFPNSATGARGFLTAADWNTFNNKQDALGYTPVDVAGDTMLGALVLNADAANPMEAVTYQQLIAWQTGLWDDRGTHDASGNTWPSSGGSGSAGAILKGDIWTISVAGTLGGVAVNPSDTIRALVNTPGTTLGNWAIGEGNLGYTPVSNVLNAGYIFVGNGSNIAAGVVPTLNASSGTFALSNAGVFTFPNATTSARGFLSDTDWNTFNGKASLASPAFTGTPTAPTAAPGTNTTQIATTAFVLANASPTALTQYYIGVGDASNFVTGTDRLKFTGSVFTVFPSATASDYGMRVDAAGVKISQITNLGSSNTYPFAINNLTYDGANFINFNSTLFIGQLSGAIWGLQASTTTLGLYGLGSASYFWLNSDGSTFLHTSVLKIDALSGTGFRMVEADYDGTLSATESVISAWVTSSGAMTDLENVSNWTSKVYTGPTLTGTFEGQEHYDSDYFYKAIADNDFIRIARV